MNPDPHDLLEMIVDLVDRDDPEYDDEIEALCDAYLDTMGGDDDERLALVPAVRAPLVRPVVT